LRFVFAKYLTIFHYLAPAPFPVEFMTNAGGGYIFCTDFFVSRFNDARRGHRYKLYLPACRSDVRFNCLNCRTITAAKSFEADYSSGRLIEVNNSMSIIHWRFPASVVYLAVLHHTTYIHLLEQKDYIGHLQCYAS